MIINNSTTDAVAWSNAAFGQGTGPILLHNVACRGLESRLYDCPFDGIEVSQCRHSQDAGVTCRAGNVKGHS